MNAHLINAQSFLNEPAHDKAYNKTYVTSKEYGKDSLLSVFG